MEVKVIVGAHGNSGPDFFQVKVICTAEDYQLGLHYDAADEWALSEGLDGPYFTFDEKDPAGYIIATMDWGSVPTVTASANKDSDDADA